MAGENAGTVYSELRLALKNIQKDISDATRLIRGLEDPVNKTSDNITNKFSEMGNNIAEELQNLSKTGINKMFSMMKGMQKAIMSVPVVGAILAIVGTVKKAFSALSEWINETTDAYIKSQQELAKLNTIVATTGAIAWASTRQLKNDAVELSRNTGFAVNDIMAMQARLLGYTNVIGETFDRATKAAADMAAVLGMDVSSAAETLGRALDHPIEGLTSLTRQGFRFKGELREQIIELTEMGRIAEAQALILQEVEETYGGVASAINDVNAAQARLTAETLRLKEARGEKISGWKLFWQDFRADIKAAKADMQEFKNAHDRALRADYTEALAGIARLREELSSVTDASERLAHRQRIVKEELELGWKELNDQLSIAIYNMEKYYKDREKSDKAWTISALEELEHRREIVAALRKQLEDHEALIEVENRAAEERQRRENAEKADRDKLEELQKRSLEIEASRIQILEEIARAERSGLITSEGAHQRRQSAYQSEADALNILNSQLARLNITTAAGGIQQRALLGQIESSFATATRQTNFHGDANARITQGLRAQVEAREEITRLIREEEEAERAYRAEMDGYIWDFATQEKHNLVQAATEAWNAAKAALGAITQLEEARDNAEEILAAASNEIRSQVAERYRSALIQLNTEFEESERNTIAYLTRLRNIQQEAHKALDDVRVQHDLQRASWNRFFTANDGLDQYARNIQNTNNQLRALGDRSAEEAENKRIADTLEAVEEITANLVYQNTRLRGSVDAIREAEKTRSWQQIQNAIKSMNESDRYANVTGEQIEQIERAFNALWAEDEPEKFFKALKDHYKDWKGVIEKHGQQAVQIFSIIMQGRVDAVKRAVDEERRILDEKYLEDKKRLEDEHKDKLEFIEKEKQAKLYAMGFVEAATQEQHEEELRKALESGDQQAIYLAHSNMKKFQIEEDFKQQSIDAEDEYNTAKKEMDDQYANDKAQLDYKVALANWKMQLLNAAVAASMATLQALASPPGFPLNAPSVLAVGGMGAAQTVVISKNKPQLQTFTQGGIVAGNSYSGDNMLAGLNSGEMVLNKRQIQNLFDAINQGNIGSGEKEIHINVNVPVNMDGKQVAVIIAKYINNRQVFINQSSVVPR